MTPVTPLKVKVEIVKDCDISAKKELLCVLDHFCDGDGLMPISLFPPLVVKLFFHFKINATSSTNSWRHRQSDISNSGP